jgi:spore maturation protein CgeB
MKIVILGLSITSSWGNGHATTYRGLVRELAARGHEVLFLERERPWYADNRDLRRVPGVEIALYHSLAELKRRHAAHVRAADAVIVGSFVPSGAAVGEWVLRTAEGVTAFYDIDTPVTLAGLRDSDVTYLAREQIARYDLYLSFTGGPTLRRLERDYGSPRARALYCSFDPQLYFPEEHEPAWNLGYLGTYSDDRQPTLERLLVACARRWTAGRFVVAGAQYPRGLVWPDNVRRIEHLPPNRHRAFYNRQQFTLNVTRANMIAAGWSPSVRLFEAAACGTPIISDWWSGLDELFRPGEEILIARSTDEAMKILTHTTPERARSIGASARRRVLAEHTAAHRAVELEEHLREARGELPVAAHERGSSDAQRDVRIHLSAVGGQIPRPAVDVTKTTELVAARISQ